MFFEECMLPLGRLQSSYSADNRPPPPPLRAPNDIFSLATRISLTCNLYALAHKLFFFFLFLFLFLNLAFRRALESRW